MGSPVIEPRFAQKIAGIYVTVYQASGWDTAQAYLDNITKGDVALKSVLVPFIVEAGNDKK